MRTERLIMPMEVIRAYQKLPLQKRKGLYKLLRSELDYGPNPDNSNIRKMLRGDRYVPATAIKLARDYLGLTRISGNIQMDIMDIINQHPPIF